MKIILTILLVTLSFCQIIACNESHESPKGDSPCSFKPGSEPDGFRGVKWETDFLSLSKEDHWMISEKGNLKFYMKHSDIGDKLKIGDAKLGFIMYGFWNNKFYGVTITVNWGITDSNAVNLKDALFGRFGKCNYKDMVGEEGEKIKLYVWRGEISDVKFLEYPYNPFGPQKDSLLLIVNTRLAKAVDSSLKEVKEQRELEYIRKLEKEKSEKKQKETEAAEALRKRKEVIERGEAEGF